MLKCVSLILYGRFERKKTAQALLENLPQVKRIDSNLPEVRILCSEELNENSLIPMLRSCGIDGFRLVKN